MKVDLSDALGEAQAAVTLLALRARAQRDPDTVTAARRASGRVRQLVPEWRRQNLLAQHRSGEQPREIVQALRGVRWDPCIRRPRKNATQVAVETA